MNEKRSDNAKQGILTAMTPILIGSGIGGGVILLLLVQNHSLRKSSFHILGAVFRKREKP